jgi:hypothetical protein
MDKVQKPSINECYAPSSETYRAFFYLIRSMMEEKVVCVHRHRFLGVTMDNEGSAQQPKEEVKAHTHRVVAPIRRAWTQITGKNLHTNFYLSILNWL